MQIHPIGFVVFCDPYEDNELISIPPSLNVVSELCQL